MATQYRLRMSEALGDADYARLLSFRTALRSFERWSEAQAKAAGLTAAQHQLLLAIRGHDDSRGPTVGQVADYLLSKHHSTVELVDRAVGSGLVNRVKDKDDRRVVRLKLTRRGSTRLAALSAVHLRELERFSLALPLFASQRESD
jgi:DNA-binding MarR family transcriptional regulator